MRQSMLQETYRKIKISTPEELETLWKEDNPVIFAFDTETNGLFHMTMKPFLVILGWFPADKERLKTVVQFVPTETLMAKMYELCGTVKLGFAHNAKFDLHAINNIYKKYPHKNIIDTMTVARLVLPAVPIDAGGDSLALKALADKYIEKSSSDEQKTIKTLKMKLDVQIRAELEQEILKAGFDKKVWNKAKLTELDEDPTVELEKVLPEDLLNIWNAWDKKYPKTKGLRTSERVTYEDIYNSSPVAKKAMEDYAFNDVIYTLEIAKKFYPYIKASGQTEQLHAEQMAMYAFWDSERIGLKIDKPYIASAKKKMVDYINQKRTELKQALNNELDASTFAASPLMIKVWLKEQGIEPKSTAKEALEELVKTVENENIKKILTLVLEIRRLIKKFSTDLIGYEINEWNGRRYTTFNQNGTVTGRVSNDMQQMPNEGILDDQGNELFHPRKAVIVDKENGFDLIAYLDYSQVEVRLQAHYTWLAMEGKGDVNMLRMFVPFNCHTKATKWDPTNPAHVNQKFIEENQWFQNEDNKPWEITDFHLLTARTAFPELKELPKDDERVVKARKKAKGVNFAVQYGAGLEKIIEMIGDKDDATKLFKGNKEAFQGLVAYGNMLKKYFTKEGYVENAYGRKYKMKYYSHKLANYVIQGSGAEILKRKIVEVDKFLKDKKSRLIHNIHDEVQIEIHNTEHNIIPELKRIMESTGERFIVPIVSDVEITKTCWYDKEEI